MQPHGHALLVTAALTLAPGRGSSCEARFSSTAASNQGFREAFQQVEQMLRARPDADCHEIEVQVDERGARVRVRSGDGREARRDVESPGELEPSIEALLVTLPEAPEARGPAPPPARPLQPPGRKLGLLVGVASGERITAPGPALTPSAGAFASLLLEPWTLGVFGRWEMAYVSLPGRTPPGFNMNGLVVGVDGGRRLALGNDAVELGATLAAGVLNEEGAEEGVGGQLAEARAGVYAAFLSGARGVLRLRPQIELDIVPTRLLNNRLVHPLLPPPPVLGLTLSLGVETDLL